MAESGFHGHSWRVLAALRGGHGHPDLEARIAELEKAHNHDDRYSQLDHGHEVAPPTPSPIEVPNGAILLNPDNLLSMVDAAPADAAFVITPGLYRQAKVHPKYGHQFYAQAGAVFDGEGVTSHAFIGAPNLPAAPSNVWIRGLDSAVKFENRNYNSPSQLGWNEGAITSKWYEGQLGGDSWLVENVDTHHNRGAGVMLTDKSVIRGCNIHHNYAIGYKVYWAPNGALVEDTETAYNNFAAAADFNETGGSKCAWTTGLVTRRVFCHHNKGDGLWTDIDNYGTIYEDCISEDNDGAGIFHEISYSALIRRNQSRRNGFKSQGWMFGAGIMVAASEDVTIGGDDPADGNIVEDNLNGISLIQQHRPDKSGVPYLLKNVHTRNNRVRGGRTGAVTDIGAPIFTERNLTWDANDYSNINGFAWEGSLDRSWAEWQGYGHDLAGSYS